MSLCEVFVHACTSAAGTWETERAQTRGVEFTCSLRKNAQNTSWPPPATRPFNSEAHGFTMTYLPDIPPKFEDIRSSALQRRCAEQGGLQLPHTSLPNGLPDATEAPVQFSKVTVLFSSWEKLPSV